MTQERDDYMRRQEADHALLDMRTRTGRQPSRGPLPQSNVPKSQTFADIRAAVFEQMDRTGEFTWPTGHAPSPRERMEGILRDVGVAPDRIAAAMPALCTVLDEICTREYHRGERDGVSRSQNRPGDGDMGG